MTVFVNGISDKTFNAYLRPRMMQALAVYPLTGISPINSSKIQIAFSDPYDGILDPEFFSVEMYNIYDASVVLDMSVVGVDPISSNL